MNYLIAVDLEGVNFVVGEPYKGLHKGDEQYDVAVREATKELNIIIGALYDSGAEHVYIWDNHGSGYNLNSQDIDSRATNVGLDKSSVERMNFADSLNIGGIIFLGYHAKEGAFNGVLAHTYSSESIQYYKIGNWQRGEFFIDANIALSKNIVPLMLVSDDICVREISEVSDDIVTVVTKHAKGRNAADFRGEDLYSELRNRTIEAALAYEKAKFKRLSFPVDLEVRYTRTERAVFVKERLMQKYGIESCFGEDSHVLKFPAQKIEDIKAFL